MSKYHNKKTEVDGVLFDSKKEANRYRELKLLERAGEITHLEVQPRFELQPKFEKNGKKYRSIIYVADFAYCETASGSQMVVEDVKGFETKEFKIKRKIFEHNYPDLSLRVI